MGCSGKGWREEYRVREVREGHAYIMLDELIENNTLLINETEVRRSENFNVKDLSYGRMLDVSSCK